MNLQVSGARSFRREGRYKWGSTTRHTSANGLSYGYCANKRSARPIIENIRCIFGMGYPDHAIYHGPTLMNQSHDSRWVCVLSYCHLSLGVSNVHRFIHSGFHVYLTRTIDQNLEVQRKSQYQGDPCRRTWRARLLNISIMLKMNIPVTRCPVASYRCVRLSAWNGSKLWHFRYINGLPGIPIQPCSLIPLTLPIFQYRGGSPLKSGRSNGPDVSARSNSKFHRLCPSRHFAIPYG